MLKIADAGGLVAVGAQYAGRQFDMTVHPDGRIELLPVQRAGGEGAFPAASSRETGRRWVEANRAELERYAQWASQREPYAQRVRRWRAGDL